MDRIGLRNRQTKVLSAGVLAAVEESSGPLRLNCIIGVSPMVRVRTPVVPNRHQPERGGASIKIAALKLNRRCTAKWQVYLPHRRDAGGTSQLHRSTRSVVIEGSVGVEKVRVRIARRKVRSLFTQILRLQRVRLRLGLALLPAPAQHFIHRRRKRMQRRSRNFRGLHRSTHLNLQQFLLGALPQIVNHRQSSAGSDSQS